jgi:tyrosyl-tRNA synthetase
MAARFHSKDDADKAQNDWKKAHQQKGIPDERPRIKVPRSEGPIYIPGLLRDHGIIASTSEGKRLIRDGAIMVMSTSGGSSAKLSEESLAITEKAITLRVGKKKFVTFDFEE